MVEVSTERLVQAMDQISKNPEMFSQATEMMKNMSPEESWLRICPPRPYTLNLKT